MAKMKRSSTRRCLAVAGAGVVLLLTACNPLPVKPYLGPSISEAKFRYSGPGDAWFEVTVQGTGGYQVETRGMVWVPQPNPPVAGPQRTCGSATERGVEVDCKMSYEEFPHTPVNHRADLDPAGTYWPYILIHPGEEARIHLLCQQGGQPVICPETTTAVARTVDVKGALIGDLQNASV